MSGAVEAVVGVDGDAFVGIRVGEASEMMPSPELVPVTRFVGDEFFRGVGVVFEVASSSTVGSSSGVSVVNPGSVPINKY